MDHMRGRQDQTALITDAQASLDDEFEHRRRRYAVMMGIRALCVVAAASTYQVSIILALAFALGGIVLPWCAVLIANDRAPKKRAPRRPFHAPPAERTLPTARDSGVIEL